MKVLIFIVLNTILWSNALANEVLKGSPQAQERQNLQADIENLQRLTETQLEEYKNEGWLVPLAKIDGTAIDTRLHPKYHWCLPWTRHFLTHLGEEFFKRFGKTIQINSAVRTIEFQLELIGQNKNAASPYPGPKQSSHLTGATVDIAKLGLEKKELIWLRKYLIGLEKQGLIEATEEHFQAVFHIMVFKNYLNDQ